MITVEELVKKIQSLTAKEIILLMVESLKNPVTDVVDMTTYGAFRSGRHPKCIGCAATNTLMHLAEISRNEYVKAAAIEDLIFDIQLGASEYSVGDMYHKSPDFLKSYRTVHRFESAINELRMGDLFGYNDFAEEGGFAIIIDRDIDLPYLDSDDYQDKLTPYIELANLQES